MRYVLLSFFFLSPPFPSEGATGFSLTICPQEDAGVSRTAKGKRKGRPPAMPLSTSFLAFLVRLHDSLPPHAQALAFATPPRTLDDHFAKMLRLFNDIVVPRLFFFEHHDVVRARLPAEDLAHHPDTLLAGDASLFWQLTPGNFLLNQLLYNLYKNMHGFHVLLSKFLDVFSLSSAGSTDTTSCIARSSHSRSLPSLRWPSPRDL